MIYVFKTSVNSKQDIERLKGFLNRILLPDTWNFDLHDCDRILRVVSEINVTVDIAHTLRAHGFATGLKNENVV